MKRLNGSEGAKDYNCPLCKDSGWIMEMRGEYEFAVPCKCGRTQKQILENKLKFATIPKEFSGHTVDNFRLDCYSTPEGTERAEMAKAIAKNYVDQFQDIQESGKGLYFYSYTKGSGKTRLAVSIANDIICKYFISAKFATTLQILDEIKSSWSGDQGDAEQKLIQDIIRVPVLVIDDIGVERSKDWIEERFYNILNGRMIQKRITIFTSNCAIEELRLDDRIVNRIQKMALPVAFPNESVRAALARQENSELLARLLG